jgi:hypothetical protein
MLGKIIEDRSLRRQTGLQAGLIARKSAGPAAVNSDAIGADLADRQHLSHT